MNEQVLLEKLRRLEQKFEASGQNLEIHLDGLLEADYLNYWDYIHLDTLLSLQVKRTTLPDEEVFIVYHQVTELYFKLIISELRQICFPIEGSSMSAAAHLGRIVRYSKVLVHSFDVMLRGMEPEQFLRFRKALQPSSGFQSVQFRCIELMCTSPDNLMEASCREKRTFETMAQKLESLYWRFGSVNPQTGKKTLTLIQFEEKYNHILAERAEQYREKNINHLLESGIFERPDPEDVKRLLRDLDYQLNIAWRKAHFYSASRYLKQPEGEIPSTGGTNWQQYLPPGFQKIIFFPSLWSAQEKDSWGLQEEETSENKSLK